MPGLGLNSQPSRASDAELPDSQKPIQNSVGYSEYIAGLDLEFTDAEARRTRWKIDLVIIPIFLITQAFQHMCRTTLNYVNLFGYQEFLELHGSQFSYLTSMVYVGYFLGQYPCGWLIGRFAAQKVLAYGVLGMGLLTILMTQCRTFGTALAVRFLVGIFTASVTPGLTLMTGFWYTRREIPLRQCIWFSAVGWGGIIGSYIAMGVSKLPPGKHERWQLIFYIMGGATCFWAFVVLSFLPDNPSAARFLSPRERIIAVSRVAANESGIKNKYLDKKQAMLSFYDLKTLLVSISIFAGSFPHAVVTSFSTVIIRDLGFSTTRTTALKSVGDAVQVVTLFMGGAVILNIRHCELIPPRSTVAIKPLTRVHNSSPFDSRGNQRAVLGICSTDGISPTIEPLGTVGVFLAGQFPVAKLHNWPHDDLLKHGRLYA